MPSNLHTTHAPDTFCWVWDVASGDWIKMTQPGGSGGGATTIADGADVAQGTTSDVAWVSGAGTVISLLKKIASAGGSAVSMADGANVTQGAVADVAWVSGNGTVISLLKKIASSSATAATTGTKVFTSITDALTLNTAGLSSFSAINTAGTFAGGLVLQGSPDNGATWMPIPYYDFNNPTWRPDGLVPVYVLYLRANIAGFTQVRLYQYNVPATSSTWKAVADPSTMSSPPGAVVLAGSSGQLGIIDGSGRLEVAVPNGVATTVANGANVALGNTADTPWSSGAGTVISVLKSTTDWLSGVNGPLTTAGFIADGDASGALANVKLGSTPAAGTDKALVVAVRDTVPISAASLPLPTNAATSALQTTGNTSVGNIDTKTPALGQALAAASRPVVLTAIQVAALTPPAAITGFALDTTLTGRTQKSQVTDGTRDGTVKAASTLPALTDTALVTTQRDPLPAGTNVIGALSANQSTNVAQMAGVAPSLNTGVRDAGTQRVTIATNDVVPVTGTFFQGTQPVSLTSTTITGTVAVTAPTLTKGTQGANGVSVQDLRDAGRNTRIFMLDAITAAPLVEAVVSVVQWYGNAAVATTVTPAVVPAGKTLRLTGYKIMYQSLATVGYAVVRIRVNTGGTAVLASPLVASFEAGSGSGATTVAMTGGVTTETGSFPEGLEIPAGSGVGFSMAGYGPTGALTLEGGVRFEVHGYEY